MSFSDELQSALKREAHRLKVAEGYARIFSSSSAKQYNAGKRDRMNGKPCASTNGHYLNGYYAD